MNKTFLKDLYVISGLLRRKYGDFNHNNKKNPLDELIFIFLSIRTNKKPHEHVFRALKKKFPRHELIMMASTKQLANVLFRGGFENKRAIMLKKIIKLIVNKFNRPTLSPLKNFSDDDCETFLTSLPGIGTKTARCIMMYSLNREVFPVDSNCWRILRRLGWIDWKAVGKEPSQKDMNEIQDRIPLEIRFSLHVNMVSLGREICVSVVPKCGKCPISKHCLKKGVNTFY